MTAPYLAAETADYGIAVKPPGLHSVPLKAGSSAPTLLDWCISRFPEVGALRGKQAWEGGLLHRLDYETQGLVLFARTQAALTALSAQQEAGTFVKEYQALSLPGEKPPGFPPGPAIVGSTESGLGRIESGFRPFGPGRQAVRPVPAGMESRKYAPALDQGRPYRTEILEKRISGVYTAFRLRLLRGFRHQIRCHLAWLGFPLVNDTRYGGAVDGSGVLGLIACGLYFSDPASGSPKNYTIPGFPIE